MADKDNVQNLEINIKVKDDGAAETLNKVADATKNVQNKLNKGFNTDGIAQQLKERVNLTTKDELATEKLKYAVKNLDGTLSKSTNSAKESAKVFEDLFNSKDTRNLDKTQKEILDLNKKTEEATKSNSKFLMSLKRIAMYRAIRAALKMITSAMKEGIQNYRTSNEELDKSLKNLSASSTALKNSFAAMLAPIIQSVQPAITAISDGLAGYINKVNEAKAATQGQDTYTKILTSDTEEYQKQLQKVNGALLSFDTFTKLSSSGGYTGTKKEEVEISKEDAQGIVDNSNVIQNAIKGLVVLIASLKILSWVAGLNTAFTALSVPILAIVAGVASIYLGFKSLFNNENLSMTEKIATAFFAVAAGILAAVIAIKLLHFDYAGAIGAGLIVAGGVAGLISLKNQAKQFANGGAYNTGDYFVANENGKTELVASTNNGGAVMNTEQLQQAIYNGMSMALLDSGGKEITLKVDNNTLGRVVANSPSFTSEMNRRNTALHLV